MSALDRPSRVGIRQVRWSSRAPRKRPRRDAVREVLRGGVRFDIAQDFVSALARESSVVDRDAAFIFDTSALVRFATDVRHPEALDYLRQDHSGPVVVPAQAVLEFWNNRMIDLSNQGDKVRQTLRSLAGQVPALAKDLGTSEDDARAIVEEFGAQLPAGIDSELRKVIDRTMGELVRFSTSAGEPRAEWIDVARARKEAKIPPGFKDAGHGDFLVWCDGLHAVADALDVGAQVSHLVVVTNDEKKDWSTKSKPHPYLVAEARMSLGLGIDLWTLEKFYEFVASETIEGGSSVASA